MDWKSKILPSFYQLPFSLGRLFGLRWVGDNKVAVIYRLGRYHRLGGPGFFWLNPFTQSVHSIIRVAPDFTSVEVPDVQTRDALQFGISVVLAYRFDPGLMLPDKAAVILTWSSDTHRAVVADSVRRALREVVEAFSSEQLVRGVVFEAIEQRLKDELADRLRPMAIEPLLCMVLRVQVPSVLQSRIETVVQRRVDVDVLLKAYEPYGLTQSVRNEVLETVQSMAGGETRVGMTKSEDEALPSLSVQVSTSDAISFERTVDQPRLGPRQDDVEPLRVDAAVPEQVLLDRAFELAVTVRQNSSPVLKEDELTLVRSGDVQVSWPATRLYISLRIQISAPECEISGPDSHSFRLYVGHDSPVFYFHLTPKILGEIGIIVRVFQKDDWLGGTRVHTVVRERLVGSLRMSISSHNLKGGFGEGTRISALGTKTEEQKLVSLVEVVAPPDSTMLRQILVLRFSFEELRTLCADLDVGYDVLPGEGQEARARELIAYLQRRERLGQLVTYIRQHRPDINL